MKTKGETNFLFRAILPNCLNYVNHPIPKDKMILIYNVPKQNVFCIGNSIMYTQNYFPVDNLFIFLNMDTIGFFPLFGCAGLRDLRP